MKTKPPISILHSLIFLSLIMLSGCGPEGDISEWRRFSQATDERHYHLFVPTGTLERNEPVALIINMHGATPSPGFLPTFGSFFQQIISGMPVHAAKNNYIVVHPQSRQVDGKQFWDTSDNVDVDFINGLVDHLISTLPVDPSRVFLSGFSSGGRLSWKLACEHGGRYAAIAVVAADRRAATACPSAKSVPVIAFHGTDDPTVSYAGGIESVESWAEEHQCQQREIIFQKADSACERWSGCNGETEMQFCGSEKAGHTWPSGPGSFVISAAGYGRTTYTINATDRLWDFFQAGVKGTHYLLSRK